MLAVQFRLAHPVLDRDAGEIRHLLAQSSQPVEKSRFARIGRSDDGNDNGPVVRRTRYRNRRIWKETGARPIPMAATHESTTKSDSGSRRIYSRAAVSLRNATSEPSTRNTRGPPPGARLPGTTSFPGRNPNSINRLAMSSGRSRRSITQRCPVGRSANVKGLGCFEEPGVVLFREPIYTTTLV
jgi:hypothetical protein